jgi:hypothetical protein
MNLELPVQDGLSAEPNFLSEMGLDQAEAIMLQGNIINPPVQHLFIPGYYVRTIRMEEGALIASKIHRTEHQYQILSGVVSVWIDGSDEPELLKAPYQGATYPGTRRLLYCHEETVWQTFHPREDHETTVEQMEERLIEPHFNELTGMTHKQMSQITSHDHLAIGNE